MTWSDPRIEPSRRQPLFNAPLLAVALAASMPILYAFQVRLADGGLGWAFSPADLAQGRWTGLFTSMLLHAGWMHAIMNAVGALAFGAPILRRLEGLRGAGAFLCLYIVSGMLAALGYGLVHWGASDALVGASGGVFGLIGAAMRLEIGSGRLMPLTDRRVIQSSAGWMAGNLVIGLIGLAPGVSGGRIAWEAHAFGYVVGLLAIGPLIRWFANTKPGFDSTPRLGDPVD